MKLSVFLNGSHVRDYYNPTFVGVVLYASNNKETHYVCVNQDKLAVFNYKITDCEIDAFNCHVNDLANKEKQSHYDWVKLEMWNEMYTDKLKWDISFSPYKENKNFIVSLLDSLFEK